MFSHGKDTGPWGSKITAMAATCRELKLAVESVDYQGIEDPAQRVDKLLQLGSTMPGSMVLVGSSLGGHVSATAARRLSARGLFLLAPAFYMRGFEAYTPQDIDCPGCRPDFMILGYPVIRMTGPFSHGGSRTNLLFKDFDMAVAESLSNETQVTAQTPPTFLFHTAEDSAVPVENSIRWAREHRAALHILESDHRLQDQIEAICRLLRDFLDTLT